MRKTNIPDIGLIDSGTPNVFDIVTDRQGTAKSTHCGKVWFTGTGWSAISHRNSLYQGITVVGFGPTIEAAILDSWRRTGEELIRLGTDLMRQAKLAEPEAKNIDDWWCPTCKRYIPGIEVTFQEVHESCGTYLTDCQPDVLASI